jgi:sulfofructose kinase
MEMNEPRFDCVGLGICALDYSCLLEKYPQLDEKIELSHFEKHGGGPVPTALATLARLGVRTAYIGKVGQDSEGDYVRTELARDGVNTDFMIQDAAVKTPCAYIWIDRPSGKRTVVLNRKSMSDMGNTQIPPSAITSGKIFLVDGWEVNTTVEILKQVKQANRTVVADFGSMRDRMEEMLSYVDYPIVSEKFVRQFWGEIDNAEAVRQLLKWGATGAVVTCGANGSFGADKHKDYFQPAFKIEVVDTNGAGDVFHGGFIYGLLQDRDFQQNLRFASAVAALKCTELGSRFAIPSLEKVEEFLKNYA